MFYLPDLTLRKRKSIFNGPLSSREYDNNKFLKNIQQKQFGDHTVPNLEKKNLKFLNTTNPNFTKPSLTSSFRIKEKDDHLIKRKQKILPYVTVFLSDLITKFEDIKSKIIVVDLEKYFEVFFRKSLKGRASKEFYQKINKYIKEMVDKKIITTDQNEAEIDNEYSNISSEFLEIKSKQKFLEILMECEKNRQSKTIYQLVKYFCVPSQQYRQQTIKDLKLILKKEIKEKFEIIKDLSEYQIFSMDKIMIRDLIQIQLNALSIIFCDQRKIQQNYYKFHNIYVSRLNKTKKDDFLETLKLSFREKIKNVNEIEKPFNVVISSRKSSNNKIPQTKKSMLRNTSEFSKKQNKTLKESSAEYKQRMQNIRNLINKFKVKQQIIEKYYTDFDYMYSLNDKFEAHFNLHFENHGLIIKQNFLKNDTYTKFKSPELKQKIIDSINLIGENGHIKLEKYVEYRLLIDCSLNKEEIINFLVKYLNLDIKMYISKNDLKSLLHPSLGNPFFYQAQYDQSNSTKVIIDTIWLWLKRNYFIEYLNEEQQVLHLRQFRQRFFGNELIYFFLVSIIFGTNQISPIQVAYQIMV